MNLYKLYFKRLSHPCLSISIKVGRGMKKPQATDRNFPEEEQEGYAVTQQSPVHIGFPTFQYTKMM